MARDVRRAEGWPVRTRRGFRRATAIRRRPHPPRAGNRRYYRPADVELARTIHRLLNSEGYTVRGVQKVLRFKDPAPAAHPETIAVGDATVAVDKLSKEGNGVDVSRLKAVRQQLAALLDD